MPTATCISLIGMAGAGKSTLGKALATQLKYHFIDTDTRIETTYGASLQALLEQEGYLGLRQREEACLLTLTAHDAVIATGGSAVYSTAGMAHLKALGSIVFLDVPLDEITRRVTNFANRGLACKPGQTFESLFNERYPLYQKAADITVVYSGQTVAQLCQQIIHTLNSKN